MKSKEKYEIIMMYLMYFAECVENLYIKVYPYFAFLSGLFILIGLAGWSEYRDINQEYITTVVIIFLSFAVLTLLWKVGNLKSQKGVRK